MSRIQAAITSRLGSLFGGGRCAFAILLFETGRVVIAQTLSDSFQPNSIRQAIALDAANPDPHFELAKILLLTGDPSQQVMAENEFRAAFNES